MKKKIINIIKSVINKADSKSKLKPFIGSEAYWDHRYKTKNNSGPGSYGRLANFKAEVINCFVKENNIQTVVEYGSGDGNQLELATYASYVGLDVSQTAINICKEKFVNDPTKQFLLFNSKNCNEIEGELVLSLDVIYHLIEDDVFEDYMRALFNSSTKYVIIYSSNYDKVLAKHVKCRKFTNWIENNLSDKWKLLKKLPNRFPFDEKDPDHTSMSDFYFYQKNNE